MSNRAVEYWVVFDRQGFQPLVSSAHRTKRNAVREATRTERAMIGDVQIVQVVKLGTATDLKRRGRP